MVASGSKVEVALANATEDIPTPAETDNNPLRPNATFAQNGVNQPQSVLPRKTLVLPLPTPKDPTPTTICQDDEPCSECCDIDAYVDIHMATPYGVSDHLLIPVYESGNAPTTSSTKTARATLQIRSR